MSDYLSRDNSPIQYRDNLDSHRHRQSNSQSIVQQERTGRPTHPPRQTSFSKRHASFDTPREVPFPSQNYFPSTTPNVYESESSPSSSSPTPPTPRPTTTITEEERKSKSALERELLAHFSESRDGTSSKTRVGLGAPPLHRPETFPPIGQTDMAIDRVVKNDRGRKESLVFRRTVSSSHTDNGDLDWNSHHLRPTLLQHLSSTHTQQQLQTDSPPISTSSSLPLSYQPYFEPACATGPIHAPTPHRPSSVESLPLPSQTPFFALPSVTPSVDAAQYEVSTLKLNGRRNSGSVSPTAFRRSQASPSQTKHRTGGSVSRSPPPQYPLPSAIRAPQPAAPPSGFGSSSSSSSIVSDRFSSCSDSSRNSTIASSFPPPTPPTIHTPPPPPLQETAGSYGDGAAMGGLGTMRRKGAPYEPFLSHAPPPIDSYISVETTEREYRLIVRLPGYKLDGITLATRRRRILHIVADSWDVGGGHFERRITFGYDADLAQVRAEFDGEHLRVVVPRRPPMGWWTNVE